MSLPRIQATWIDAEGKLDVEALLTAWVSCWRMHGETMQTASPYAEAAGELTERVRVERVKAPGGCEVALVRV